ncbi:MAG: hypothetical protein AAGJ82_00945 [Bacteroidota bacterium]
MSPLAQARKFVAEGKPLEALAAFKRWAQEHLPSMVSDVELQQARVNMLVDNFRKGLTSMADYNTSLLQINNGILFLLDEAVKKAPPTNLSTGQRNPPLHEYHAYTCDRIEQNDRFRECYGKAATPVQFYFLYGGDLQSHEGFFRRISYDLEGRLQDYLNPNLALSSQAVQLEMTFEFSRQLAHYKQNILRSFFSMLGLPPNEHEPLLEKDLSYVLERSPRLKNLQATDYICVYLHISQYDWDPEVTPDGTRWFINEFCQKGNLPTPAPLLFFLAIEYDEEDAALREEVLQVLQTAETLQPLPELGMVTTRDIGGWLERYKQLSPNSRTRRELLKTTFPERENYMEDVELAFKKIIDQYNNNLLS